MQLDKGYHLLKALGFEEMARQSRSTKEPTTSRSCLNFIIDTAYGKGIWDTEQQMCKEVLARMDMDEWEESR